MIRIVCPECKESSREQLKAQQSIIGFRIAKDCTSCGWASEET